ncbi:DUF6215 domain-containing protein [Streptomyces sp. NPDC014006]|uniref:DUF6215 domain-containing protein n=1 Tax=Streptomyces sp. NPDC014006 TaxID=3364870 RepID=UPI0036F713EE
MSWGAQVLLALLLCRGLAGGLWHMEQSSGGGQAADRPASCSPPSNKSLRKAARAGRVTGDQLCEALNRADLPALPGTPAERKKILGRQAALSCDQTIGIGFDLGGGNATAAPGGIARTLVVAPDTKDSGGSYEVAVWRQDGGLPDDAALLRGAEKVLPAVPGRDGS